MHAMSAVIPLYNFPSGFSHSLWCEKCEKEVPVISIAEIFYLIFRPGLLHSCYDYFFFSLKKFSLSRGQMQGPLNMPLPGETFLLVSLLA